MVKRKIIWSPGAKIDIFEILDFYYRRNGTKTYSVKLNSKIRTSVRLLENHYDIGVQSDVHNIRNLIEGDYSIFYEIKGGNIEIITIWDNRRNPDSIHKKQP
jgi:toxin YoeB